MKVSLGFMIRHLHTGQMMAFDGEVCEFYLTHPADNCASPRVWKTAGQAMVALTRLGQEMGILLQMSGDDDLDEVTQANYARHHLEWTTFLDESRIVEIFTEG
jgi:hypothetical protein